MIKISLSIYSNTSLLHKEHHFIIQHHLIFSSSQPNPLINQVHRLDLVKLFIFKYSFIHPSMILFIK